MPTRGLGWEERGGDSPSRSCWQSGDLREQDMGWKPASLFSQGCSGQGVSQSLYLSVVPFTFPGPAKEAGLRGKNLSFSSLPLPVCSS